MAAPMLTPRRVAEALRDPAAAERWSALTGDVTLGVDLEGELGDLSGDSLRACTEGIRRLYAVSWGVGRAVSPEAQAIAEAVDVRVEEAADADAVVDAANRNPHAAAAFVQLLRQSGHLPLADAVVAESWVYSVLQSGSEFARWLAGRDERKPEEPRSAPVRVELRGERLEISLDRPEKRNAFSAAMRDALCEALRLACADPQIIGIDLRGNGPSFCSGGDLDEFGSLPDPAIAHAIRSTRSAALLLVACGSRVHAWVHGACIGAGVELPAFCARVTAKEDSIFQLPEVGMGLIPGAGGTASLPRRIGRQRAAWLGLTGRRIPATTALSWGLVDEIG